ncbi:MAG: transglutaminase domain-containing protein [Myxococcaceae bacterium]|nr:transglutaminase domain-containing protein [Myxococcaceae bacterium]
MRRLVHELQRRALPLPHRANAAIIALPLTLLATGCLSLRPALREVSPADRKALDAAAEAFFRADAPAALQQAVAQARALAPEAALTHELLALHAALEGREADEVRHLVSALGDTANPTPALHLHLLMMTEFSFAQRAEVRELLRALSDSHPRPEVRSLAAFHLASLLTSDGRLAERDALIADQPGRFPLAIVGTWDNDQGKGFDLVLAPESRPGLDQTYEGRFGKLEWRRDVPLDPRGRLELSSLMTPSRFAVAYVQGQPIAPDDGQYQLRLMTTGPLKVWVDGQLLFSAPLLERSVFDNVIVPLKLSKGPHTVLIKTAHKEGAWSLGARLVPASSLPMAVPDVERMVDFHVRGLPPKAARTLAHRALWAHHAVGGITSVKAADEFVRSYPASVLSRVFQVEAVWFNQERGRAADALSALDREVGDALAFVRLRQLRFWQQQGLKQKARSALVELTKKRPELGEAWELLVEAYRSEGWLEDELATQRARLARFGEGPDGLLELSRMLQRFGRRADAEDVLDDLRDDVPLHPEVLRRLVDLALDAGELERADALLVARVESWPTDFGSWMQLAEVRRRKKDALAARSALDKAASLAPEAANPWVKRGDLAYEEGDVPQAVAAWRKALERNPENEALANRVEALSPEARGAWLADAPDDDAIARAVARRKELQQTPGADVAWLLDHEVTQLNNDGSTSNVVTMVAHAFNAQGRDRLIKQTVGQGRLRVLHSYSIDEKGQRTEASSERSRQIFFRGLQPNATVVLQYRLDVPPRGYLSRYLTKSWAFQSLAEQRLEARYVMWMPLGTTLNEQRIGGVARVSEKRGEQLRVEWSSVDSPPVVSEPSMPPLSEVAANIKLSSVPDWTTYLSWEKSLLEGVFRDSPEVDAVARRLADGAKDNVDRLERIHQFVMEEIRYQQDYESFIAGVKPHPAPMVLERRYGDCKDKAVLFITLAKKLGLEAHFANVRTRDAGQIAKEVPMQQFNHAIVYVPKQAGVDEGRFFDPTADLLDLDVVRSDDVGTQSLVIDPTTGEHTFREIPFQDAGKHRLSSTVELDLSADGSARGRFGLEARGRGGSALRVASRDAELFQQAVQRIASGLVPNSTTSGVAVVEAKDLRRPAKLEALVEARTFARSEGDTLRIKVPSSWNPRGLFSLASRRHTLVLGTPFTDETTFSVTLPEGFEARKLPASGTITQQCLELNRTVTQAGRTVTSRAVFRVTCDRVAPAEYPTYRSKVDEMMRLLEDELVVGPAASRGAAKKPVPVKTR